MAVWYRTKLAELTEGIRPLINWKWTKIGFKGWKQRNGDGAGSSEKEKNLGYFHQVSLLDYFLGSEPKVGVASSAGGRPFIYFLSFKRVPETKNEAEMRWDHKNRGLVFASRHRNNTSPLEEVTHFSHQGPCFILNEEAGETRHQLHCEIVK